MRIGGAKERKGDERREGKRRGAREMYTCHELERNEV